MKEKIKKEFNAILLLTGAILITIFLVPFGIVYNIGKAIYHALKLKPIFAIGYVIKYWLKILYQLWNVVKYIMVRIAVALDLIWNATSGEMIEDFVTTKEETFYGRGNVTVSAATGNLEELKELNDPHGIGLKFSNFLSKTLGEKHCIEAWKKENQYPINE